MNNPYIRLMRLDKPIGIYLLLYPTLWALLLAGSGIENYIIFILGVIVMRSAGCVINDFADRNIDKFVARTKHRPLTTGEVSSKNALLLFAGLMIVALLLVLLTNTLTIFLGLIAGLLAFIYPFSKRFFAIPQLFLGVAFAMSVPMSFSATLGVVPNSAWIVFIATIVWTVFYDTQYAMSDKEDDLKIGVRSSAIYFGKFDTTVIALLQVVFVALLISISVIFTLGFWYVILVGIVILLLIYQQFLTFHRNRDTCFQAFLNNNIVGLVITVGVIIETFN
jgi:4-hydroxybenzoate polyprenyltransferase